MATVEKILKEMKNNRHNVRFSECLKVCTKYFGKPKINGSHHIFKTPWQGECWVNIQNKNGYVKSYQVEQVIEAIEKLEAEKFEAEKSKGEANV